MDNNFQNYVSESKAVVNNILEENNYDKLMKKNKKEISKQICLILFILAAVLIISGFGYLFYLNNNPVKVYQTAITSIVDSVFDGVYQDYDKTNTTIKLAANVNLTEGLVEQEMIDYINKTSIALNTQIDANNQQMVFKIDSDHDNESLLDIAMFVNAKDKKTYLYAKDYFDKYLEVELDDYTTLKEAFEELKMTKTQKANANRAKKILKKEISKLITKDDCYKKDGAFVFEVIDKELANKLKTLITNLKDNKDFLECFEDSDTVKELLELMLESYTEEEYTNEKMTITMTKGFFSSIFDKLTIDLSGFKLLLENKDNKAIYEFHSNGSKVVDGYIKTTKEKNTEKLELSVIIPELGSVTLYIDTTVLKNTKVEMVDASKVVKLEELSEDEMMEIMTKIEESPLYELISKIEPEEDNGWDDEDFDTECNGILEHDGVSIKLNLPSKAEGNYCDTYYASYDIDDISVDYDLWDYDSYNEYFEEVKDDLKYQDGNSAYQNKFLSNVKTKTINERTYYYVEYIFDYVSYGTTKVYQKYICTKIKNDVYLTIEISSWGEPIVDGIVNSLLNFE